MTATDDMLEVVADQLVRIAGALERLVEIAEEEVAREGEENGDDSS